jgi:hypothetical protein
MFLAACSYAYSQSSIQLMYKQQVIPNEDTITINTPLNRSIDVGLDIANISVNSVELMIKRKLISLLSGSENLFCFGIACFDSDVDETPESYPLAAGDTLFYDSNYFHTTHRANGQKGISIVKYTFYDNNNPMDSTSVIFKFNSDNVGINDYERQSTNCVVYPNPTTGQLRITNYELEMGEIEIYDVAGKKLLNCQLSTDNLIDISHLANGLYFLKTGNKTMKIIKQ